MASITYDDRSYLVDGKRIWLSSGSVHYFRIPAALWAERLLAAKRAGLNCIDTYIAWNFHEPKEGQWDFTGDKDVAAFIRLAGKMGLYVILRPGPYICSEWDFGGLPSWLTTKAGIAYRTNNAVFMHYFDKYFRQVLPRLAEQQVTRGGNILLIQNENEYGYTTMPDRLAYLEFINQLIRRAGFDIPIINCNWLTDPPVPDTIECANGYDGIVREFKRLRQRQPNAPLLATEFWPGWFDFWGSTHSTRDPRQTARIAMEIVGCGAQANYYMWCGGTNFGFWGSRLGSNDGAYQTTSYDSDAPMAEAGGLTRKYYLNKLVCMMANHMGRFLATCHMGTPGATIENASQVYNLTGSAGNWAIVSNGGRDDIKSVELTLADGTKLTVPLEVFGAAALPINLKLLADATLDYTNLTPLGFFHEKTLVLHGPAGWAGLAKVNGKSYTLTVPAGDEVKLVQADSVLLVVVNSELAMRTWWLEDTLVFGPDYVGATVDDLQFAPHAKDYFLLGADGKLLKKKAPKTSAAKPAMPKPTAWKLVESCAEAHDAPLQWTKIDRPKDVDSLGIGLGYVWYRIELAADKSGRKQLFLPDCEDRATIFHNGSPLAIWGRGPGATREPVAVTLPRGKNVLTVLLDNMGRVNYGPNLGEIKGLYGHVYSAKPLKLAKFKLKQLDTFPRRVVPRRLTHVIADLERRPVWQATVDLPLSQVLPVHLSFTNFMHYIAVLCNERLVSFDAAGWSGGYADIRLSGELQKGKNKIELLIWGDLKPEDLDKLRFHLLEENLTQPAAWGIRPWQQPEQPASHPTKRRGPAWFSSHFKRPQTAQPVWVRLTGGGKGQLYLNRHNIGRYWSIGPQELYYLPSCWLADENELMIFEETGTPPTKLAIEVHPAGPYR
jgi:hypothetical protein